jgi:hypothetical protein
LPAREMEDVCNPSRSPRRGEPCVRASEQDGADRPRRGPASQAHATSRVRRAECAPSSGGSACTDPHAVHWRRPS